MKGRVARGNQAIQALCSESIASALGSRLSVDGRCCTMCFCYVPAPLSSTYVCVWATSSTVLFTLLLPSQWGSWERKRGHSSPFTEGETEAHSDLVWVWFTELSVVAGICSRVLLFKQIGQRSIKKKPRNWGLLHCKKTTISPWKSGKSKKSRQIHLTLGEWRTDFFLTLFIFQLCHPLSCVSKCQQEIEGKRTNCFSMPTTSLALWFAHWIWDISDFWPDFFSPFQVNCYYYYSYFLLGSLKDFIFILGTQKFCRDIFKYLYFFPVVCPSCRLFH